MKRKCLFVSPAGEVDGYIWWFFPETIDELTDTLLTMLENGSIGEGVEITVGTIDIDTKETNNGNKPHSDRS